MARNPSILGKAHLACWALTLVMTGWPTMSLEARDMLKLDHVGICSSDFDALHGAFSAAGLAADPDGLHVSRTGRQAHIGFDDRTYIELAGPGTGGSAQGSPWSALISGDAGPCYWFVHTADIGREVTRLNDVGIAVTQPREGGRTTRDGHPVRWASSVPGSAVPGTVLPLIIEDRTPRDLRIAPSNALAASSLGGVGRVVLAVGDLDASVAMFRRAYNLAAPRRATHREFGRLAYFPGSPIILANSTSGWVGERVRKHGDGPVAYLLTARDFGAARKRFALSRPQTLASHRVAWFDPQALHGVRLGVIGGDR